MSTTDKTTTIIVKLPDKLKKRFISKCKKEDTTISQAVRQFIKESLKR